MLRKLLFLLAAVAFGDAVPPLRVAPQGALSPMQRFYMGSDPVTEVSSRRAGPVFTERDAGALAFLAEQYGARLDVLGVVLGRLGGGGSVPLSNSGVRQQLGRWVRAGWVRTEVALGSTWVTPTPWGMAVVGRRYAPWKLPVTKLAHTHAVSAMRLWYEASPARVERYGSWVSERALFARRDRTDLRHVPDGALLHQGASTVWAVEVELTAKHRPCYAEELFGRLDSSVVGVLYFVPPGLLERVRRDVTDAVAKTGHSGLGLDVRVLPSVPGVSYCGQGIQS